MIFTFRDVGINERPYLTDLNRIFDKWEKFIENLKITEYEIRVNHIQNDLVHDDNSVVISVYFKTNTDYTFVSVESRPNSGFKKKILANISEDVTKILHLGKTSPLEKKYTDLVYDRLSALINTKSKEFTKKFLSVRASKDFKQGRETILMNDFINDLRKYRPTMSIESMKKAIDLLETEEVIRS